MNKKESRVCDVTENGFRTVSMLPSMGAVQINTKNASILHSTYNALLAIKVLRVVPHLLYGYTSSIFNSGL
jgi:hypothetical protein